MYPSERIRSHFHSTPPMRARNLKPGFFINEDLLDLPPLARLLFAGLWCMADREGRLEDRPKRIKFQVLPADDCDVDELLDALAGRGLIVRYVVNDQAFIAIPNFGKHQNPHVKEAPSTIPAPDEHGASTVQVPDEHGSSPAESPFSESPFSESPFSESRGVGGDGASTEPAALAEDFHTLCPSLPRVRQLTDSRKKRLAKAAAELGTEGLRDFFRRVEASDFLSGRKTDWRADLDWILKPEHVTKILEGSYDNRNGPTKTQANVSKAMALVNQAEREEAMREAV